MSKRSRAVFVLSVCATTLVSGVLSADGTPADAKRKRGDGAAALDASQKYRDARSQGNGKYAARDFAGAVEAYRKAIEMDAKNPLGHYLLGEAQLAAGS